MSLHLGNLSSRIRRDDIERVFRRFGRCSIQIKDKYGFVVYDYPASAEKALKTLQGTRICGEAITLSWSKKQPRAMQRFASGGKSYEPPRRKYPAKENVDQRFGNRRNYDMDKQEVGEGRKVGSSDLVNGSTSYHRDDSKGHAGERYRSSPNNLHEVGGDEDNILDDDRWEEQVVDPSNDNYVQNGTEFDRYELYHSDDKELDEHHEASPLVSSPSMIKSQERAGNFYNPKSQDTCFSCGEKGHKMRQCPLDLKRQVSRSERRMGPGGDTFHMRGQESDRYPSASRNHERLLRRGDSPPQQITPRGRRKESKDKKRNWGDHESQDKRYSKRAKRTPSNSVQSGYISSRSRSPSRSLKSLSRSASPSNPNSMSSKKNSRPFSSRPSTSLQPTLRSMTPTSSSLPSELNTNLSPSPNDEQLDSRDSETNNRPPPNRNDLLEQETLVTTGKGASESANYAMENDLEARPVELEEEQLHTSSNLLQQHADEIRGSQSEDLVREHVLGSDPAISSRPNESNSVGMSSDEIYMVMKHYGLHSPDENEKDIPAEVYFGSARFWPWEIIYYRRLRKGPISAENYSRRIAQNEEFGIVDRYIRSSSGWGELNKDNA